jgi:hypothetical protein
MKTTDEQEILLNTYFKTYRINIPDKGFTNNTMNKLPKIEPWFSRKDILITVSLIIGVIILTSCRSIIGNIITTLNLYALLFIMICFAGLILTIISVTDPESELI